MLSRFLPAPAGTRPVAAASSDVGDRVRVSPVQELGGLAVEGGHPTKSGGKMGGVDHLGLGCSGQNAGAEGFGKHERVAWKSAGVAPDSVGMDGAGDGEAVEQLLALDRVAAGEHRARFSECRQPAAQDFFQGLTAVIGEWKADQVHAGERRAAHRPHVGERVDCGDATKAVRIIHHRREEIGGVNDPILGSPHRIFSKSPLASFAPQPP